MAATVCLVLFWGFAALLAWRVYYYLAMPIRIYLHVRWDGTRPPLSWRPLGPLFVLCTAGSAWLCGDAAPMSPRHVLVIGFGVVLLGYAYLAAALWM